MLGGAGLNKRVLEVSDAHHCTIEGGRQGWAVPSVTVRQGVRGDPGTPSGREHTDWWGEWGLGVFRVFERDWRGGSGWTNPYKDR